MSYTVTKKHSYYYGDLQVCNTQVGVSGGTMDNYTEADAQFDAEARGDCGRCGRSPAECGHCEECGNRNSHRPTCSQRVIEHTICDKNTHRIFNLWIQGRSLVKLQEFKEEETPHYSTRWEDIDQQDPWWVRLADQVDNGAFHLRSKT